MDQDRTDFGDIAIVFGIEFGANEAFHHGVNRFQVWRVIGQAHVHFFATRGIDIRAITEVVFYIAFKIFEAFFGFILEDVAFEFAENLAVGFVENVG